MFHFLVTYTATELRQRVLGPLPQRGPAAMGPGPAAWGPGPAACGPGPGPFDWGGLGPLRRGGLRVCRRNLWSMASKMLS